MTYEDFCRVYIYLQENFYWLHYEERVKEHYRKLYQHEFYLKQAYDAYTRTPSLYEPIYTQWHKLLTTGNSNYDITKETPEPTYNGSGF